MKASSESHLSGICFPQPMRTGVVITTGMSCPPQGSHLLRAKHGYLINWTVGTYWVAFFPMALPSARLVIPACFVLVKRPWLADKLSSASWACVWAQRMPISLYSTEQEGSIVSSAQALERQLCLCPFLLVIHKSRNSSRFLLSCM